jgi:adenine phosphoribosyltransferase
MTAMTTDEIRSLIVDVPDFPKPGIVFKDITPLLANPAGRGATIDLLAAGLAGVHAEALLAIESRGFIFGALLAERLGLPLELVRKRGKLPRAALSVRYDLEYGCDHLEVHADALREGGRYLIVDDVIATGGTAAAVLELVRGRAAVAAACVFVIELEFLQGRRRLEDCPVLSLLRY